VDDRGDTATLTLVTEVLGASGEGNGITAGISTTVECGAIQRLQESPAPVASLGPSPSLEPAASGSEAHRST
jgi:hypothetical protein